MDLHKFNVCTYICQKVTWKLLHSFCETFHQNNQNNRILTQSNSTLVMQVFFLFWYTAEAAVRNFVQNKCSYKLRNIHRQATVLKSHFSQVADLKAYNIVKRESNTGVLL